MAVKIGGAKQPKKQPSIWDSIGSTLGGMASIIPGMGKANNDTLGNAAGAIGNYYKDPVGNMAKGVAGVMAGMQPRSDPMLAGPTFERAQIQAREHAQSMAEQAARNPAAAAPSQGAAYQPTLADYLNQAMQMMGGGGSDAGAIYDQQAAQAKAQAASQDQSLKGMYAGLVSELAAQTAPIGNFYNSANTALQGQQQAATQNVGNAYGAAQASQNSVLDALGIGDQARGNLAVSGNAAANDQAHALSDIAQTGSANQQANTEHKATSQTYNTELANSANSAGAAGRAQLQQQLAATLTGLSSKASDARVSQSSNQFSQALQLAQALNSDQFNRQQQSDSNSYNAEKLASAIKPASTKLDPQDLLSIVQKFFGNNTPNPQDYARVLQAVSALNN